jgi:hypothetical protein
MLAETFLTFFRGCAADNRQTGISDNKKTTVTIEGLSFFTWRKYVGQALLVKLWTKRKNRSKSRAGG